MTTPAESGQEPQREGQPDPSHGEGSTPVGMDRPDVEERSLIARHLGRSAFPGTKHELLDVARSNDAPDHVLAELSRLPDETFGNVQDVARALGHGTEQQRN
jgi:hypothetical protein